MSKAKSNGKIKCSNTCCAEDPSSFVFIVKTDADDGDIVKLRHPQKESPALFLLTSNKKVYEIFTFSDPHRSYFLDESIQSDGKMYITSLIDPLFLILPYLQSSSRFVPLDHILADEKFPDMERLADFVTTTSMDRIGDQKGDPELKAYMYNEEKTLSWLERKVKKTVNILKEKEIHVGKNASVSANFVKGEGEKDTLDNYTLYAYSIISGYLNEELKAKLSKHIGIKTETETPKRKQNGHVKMPESKKIKIEVEESSPPTITKLKNPSQSAKEKARVKAAVGSKSISSFFAKKT